MPKRTTAEETAAESLLAPSKVWLQLRIALHFFSPSIFSLLLFVVKHEE